MDSLLPPPLGIVGWGTVDNGLLLYSLYFGWAYICLLVRLVRVIPEPYGFARLLILAAVIAILCIRNIPALRDVLVFATKFFPLLE